jgi:hypothetical protein
MAELAGDNKEALIGIRATWSTQVKKLNREATDDFDDIKDDIKDINWEKLGKYIVKGITTGIDNNKSGLVTATVNAAMEAYNAAKEALEIESPSKKFAELGKFSVLGMVKGLSENAHKAGIAGKEVAKTSMAGMQNAIKSIDKLINSELDAVPVIRPVIDMSSIKSGIIGTNSLLTKGISTFTANANALSITDKTAVNKDLTSVNEAEKSNSILDKIKQIIVDNKPEIDLSGTLKVQVVNDEGAIIGITQTAIRDILRRESR